MNDNQKITIDHVGHKGDGIGHADDKRIFAPFTLPGETVSLSPFEILTPASDRQEPECQYFGTCGGCQLQHWNDEAYRAWKIDLLRLNLVRHQLELPIRDIRTYPTASRRRIVLNAEVNDGQVSFGHVKRSSNGIVDIESCSIATPELERVLLPARELCKFVLTNGNDAKASKPMRARLYLLACQNGIDLGFESGQKLAEKTLRELPLHPRSRSFIRIAYNGETLFETKKPYLECGIAKVTPAPGGFVQASAAAETDLAELVVSHLKKCKQTADLFCGFGTFALRLAQYSRLQAFENDQPALDALDTAWRQSAGQLKTISTLRRDLFRNPVRANELKKTDGLVFDPPRAGAEAQSMELAKSNVTKVAAVSCNPQTLARDLAILQSGGYTIKSIHPIDQFRYTPHLETVALLEKCPAILYSDHGP